MRPSASDIEIGHGAAHEFVEQGYGKGHVAVGRTKDHAFFDQTGAYRPQGINLNFELIGYVTGTGPVRVQK